jgi:hypothetical protein
METGAAIRELQALGVLGWRVWTVTESRKGLRLASVIYEGVWIPGELARAACRREENPFATSIGPHDVPGTECSCGFHAARDPVDALSYLRGRDEPRTIGRVLGEVVLSGTLVETEAGWRAEAAYPARLYVEDGATAAGLAVYGVPVLSPGCASLFSRTCTATPSPSALPSRTSSIKTLT